MKVKVQDHLEKEILLLRGQKVILGQSLAALYGVEPRVLIQAVKRNEERFPSDFMFQVTEKEFQNLKSQFVTSSWGGLRTRPYAFTEQGIAMLSSVLNSPRAIRVNIEIMRAFVRLRRLISTNVALAHKINELERKYDSQFGLVFEAIRNLMIEDENPVSKIGFRPASHKDKE